MRRAVTTGATFVLLFLFAARAAEGNDDKPYYNQTAGQSSQDQRVARDGFGNAAGPDYDLARNGAFKGEKVAVLQLYAGNHRYTHMMRPERFDFVAPQAALAEKGFDVIHWKEIPPPPELLERELEQASQLWLISDETLKLSPAHLHVIKTFFERGRGLYLWGDNEPYYADTNVLAKTLFGATMAGNLPGTQTLQAQKVRGGVGFLADHLLTTGLENLYEGNTIATIQGGDHALRPLIYGSAGNLVAAYYEQAGRRAIIDAGFTRLYNDFYTAGTSRLLGNAGAWLANRENRHRTAPGVSPDGPAWYKTSGPNSAPAARKPLGQRYRYGK